MKLVNIHDIEVMLALQIFHLIWALPAFEPIPEFEAYRSIA